LSLSHAHARERNWEAKLQIHYAMSKNISSKDRLNCRSLRYAAPDFLLSLVALANFMRLSLRKAAHADLSTAAQQEIRVRSGRDDKGEGDASMGSGC
jgi:hypothetical protein